MSVSLLDHSGISLRDLLQSGDISAAELTAVCLDRIAAMEPGIRAWAFIDADGARRAAEEADRRRAAGETLRPLHGLPVGVKDTYDTSDMPTEFGTQVHRGRRPHVDATMVHRLRKAGAIVIGKTVTSEYAVYTAGPTRNPRNLLHTPGGSSSGSAAGVAAGMVPFSLATQTNGSTIRPASFCGVVGYKPGLGLMSRSGILVQSDLLDQPGVMARTVADAAVLTTAMAGPDPSDPRTLGYPPPDPDKLSIGKGAPRLAFIRSPYWNRLDTDSAARVEGYSESLGSIVEELLLPPEFDGAADLHSIIMGFDIAAAYRADYQRAGHLMSETLVGILERGASISAETYSQAVIKRNELLRRFSELITSYDAVITPATRGIAPRFEDGTGDPIMSTLWTLLGLPAITLPLLTGAEGMPLGVQLVGRPRDDGTLLATAAWLEERHGPSHSASA